MIDIPSKNVETTSYLLFLSDCNETRIFFKDFRKKAKISTFIKIRPVGAELFRAVGRTERQTETERLTDMKKLIVALRNDANAPDRFIITSKLLTLRLENTAVCFGCCVQPCSASIEARRRCVYIMAALLKAELRGNLQVFIERHGLVGHLNILLSEGLFYYSFPLSFRFCSDFCYSESCRPARAGNETAVGFHYVRINY
jgi:hypothetical protein